MSNTIWKRFEAEIASWMGTKRNPLSGANNYTDGGNKRHGDVVSDEKWDCIIECKTRRLFPVSGTYFRALETLKEATEFKIKHWFHFERKTGSKKVYILATNREWMKRICAFLSAELSRDEIREDEK